MMGTRIISGKDVWGHYNFTLEEYRKHSHYNFFSWNYLTRYNSYSSDKSVGLKEAKQHFKVSFLGSA